MTETGYRILIALVFISFPIFLMTCKPSRSRRPDISFRDRSRAADEETDDIDEQGGNGQHAEEQRLREDDPKEGVQRIDSGREDQVLSGG